MTTIRPDENCPYCGLPDEADREMVQCDRCDVWYHFRCAGVTRAVKHQSWFCGPCQAERHYGPNPELNPAGSEEDNFSVPPSELSSLRSHTSSSIRQGLQLLDEQFQVRQKRLAEEKAMQERRLALEEEYAKQQNDLREEHLKVRQELLSSLRDMSLKMCLLFETLTCHNSARGRVKLTALSVWVSRKSFRPMKQVAVQDMKEFLTGWGAGMFPQTQNKMSDAHAPLHDNNTTCHQLSPKIRGVRVRHQETSSTGWGSAKCHRPQQETR
ncbi:predicted protein [Culex quinquefasciatus]|uniref:Predicted protein n=1 Tax=Culex quinquefasciatus TaxID=7176 RepID=B0WCZ2_CULQU|nr:predicted protein [Culex quinquefasciatus]|eukprot:XP_001846576.1 predicted protein [Culex quinquefasciatus]